MGIQVKDYIKRVYCWFSKQFTFTNIIVVGLLYKSTGWIDQSYALAWAGKTEIAESLSKIVVTDIIAVFIVAGTKALFENLSKNNNWPDKPSLGTKPITERDC
ncbi:hypothetical protein [Anaerovorax odorimutans]|uniref:hypothetical protein n=1 Tax=Anaerovorax odorimutans TaxID=109327 RepID=UPI000421F8B4|nr:hypothetical protein [Anaerovorax odorimutans]